MGTNWRDEYKSMEQINMQLLDQIARVGKELGFKELPFWGDSTASVDDMIEKIKDLNEKAWMYEDLCK